MSAVLEAREADARFSVSRQPTLLRQFDLQTTVPKDVARLRQLVLTLAIQGKLVRQEAGDEPASRLLDRARAEKAQLEAQGRCGRIRHAEPISNEEQPFELPPGWVWARLPEVCYDFGQQVPTSDFTYIDVGSLDNERACVTDSVQVLGAKDAPSRARKLVARGTVLYSTVRPYLRNIALVTREYAPKAIASTAFAVLHPHTGVDGKYLLYYLRSEVFTQFVTSKMLGVAYPAINDATFFQGLIALPPAAEQARIVARVDELMRLCNALEAKGRLEAEQHARLLATLLGTLTDSRSPEELAANWQRVAAHFDLLLDRPEAVDALEQSVIHLAVSGLLVSQRVGDEPASELLTRIRSVLDASRRPPGNAGVRGAFDLPSGWEWARIDTLADVQGGIQKTPLRKPLKNHYLYLRVANVQRDALDLRELGRFELTEEELAKWRLRSGDILIVEGNGSDTEIGRCAIWKGEIDPCVYQNHLIRIRCPEAACVDFIRLFLNSTPGRAEMKRLAITTSGLFNLSVGKIRSIAAPIPPIPEQRRILARVAQLRRLCADLRERLAASRATQARLADTLVESATAA